MHHRINQSDQMTFPGLSQLVRVGDLVVLSGQAAFDDEGNLVGENDPVAQAEQCFENISRLLQMAGGSTDDVVKLTCYLTDKTVYPAYAQAKRRYLGPNAPAGTALVVNALLRDDFLLEVEAMAVIPNREDQ